MSEPVSGRPLEMHSSFFSPDDDPLDPNEQINEAIRRRAWNPSPQVVNLIESPPPPGLAPCYRPEGVPFNQRSGACPTVDRPTEGETHHAMNEAIRNAARQILGR
jgi:hypothetical protein